MSALSFKGAGNRLFNASDFAGAIDQYSQAIEAARAAPGGADSAFLSRLLSNRALCHLKLSAAAAAESDADLALSLDPSNAKALRHRGICGRTCRLMVRGYRRSWGVSLMHPRAKAARTLSNLRRSGSSAEVGSGASGPSYCPTPAPPPDHLGIVSPTLRNTLAKARCSQNIEFASKYPAST